MVPQPSLKTRLFLSTSFIAYKLSEPMRRAVVVSVNACPILAAHFAGLLMAEKSPNDLMIEAGSTIRPWNSKGAQNQHV